MFDSSFSVLAQSSGGGEAAAGIFGMLCFCVFSLIYLAVIVAVIAGGWKMFVKAGQPGWAVLVPFYNAYIVCKIVGRPDWWFLLLLIPIVGAIFGIILAIDLAKSFGKDVGYALGIIFLGFIFIPMLGFGKAQYQGPSVSA